VTWNKNRAVTWNKTEPSLEVHMGWTFSTGDPLLAAFLGCAGYQCGGVLPPCERLGPFPSWFCGDDEERDLLIRQAVDFYRRIGCETALLASPDAPIPLGFSEERALHLVGILETLGAADQLLMVDGDFNARFDGVDYIVNVLLPTAMAHTPSARRRALVDRRN
jgi:hypothetical protein